MTHLKFTQTDTNGEYVVFANGVHVGRVVKRDSGIGWRAFTATEAEIPTQGAYRRDAGHKLASAYAAQG